MHSSILLLATLSGHSLAIAIAKPYDPSISWGELPGLEAYNYNLPNGDYLAQTPAIITPNPNPISLPYAAPTSTCTFPSRAACCGTTDYTGCYDAAYTSFCSGKPLVCCSRVDITSRIGQGCGPLNGARPAPQSPSQSPSQSDTTEEVPREPATGVGQPSAPKQVPVPNAPGVEVPEGVQENSNPIWWLDEEQKKGQQ